MCCHEHPDNGSDLAVASVEETDVRAQLQAVREERDRWEEDAKRYAGNAGYWAGRADYWRVKYEAAINAAPPS